MALAVSVRPAPISPEKPRISPFLKLKANILNHLASIKMLNLKYYWSILWNHTLCLWLLIDNTTNHHSNT